MMVGFHVTAGAGASAYSGVMLLVASILAGWLWDAFGPGFTFYAGAALTLVAWIALLRHGRGAADLRPAGAP